MKFKIYNYYKFDDAGVMINIIPKLQLRNNRKFIEIQIHIIGFMLQFIKYK